MDWFERLTGFREGPCAETRAKLKVDAERLRSQVNGKSCAIGRLELVSLGTLRARTKAALAAGSITVAALESLEGVIAQAFTGVGRHLDRLPIYTSRSRTKFGPGWFARPWTNRLRPPAGRAFDDGLRSDFRHGGWRCEVSRRVRHIRRTIIDIFTS
jgi:hypothetical protein